MTVQIIGLAVVMLLMAAIACLWTIAEQLQAIGEVLKIAHADALREHLEDEIEEKYPGTVYGAEE